MSSEADWDPNFAILEPRILPALGSESCPHTDGKRWPKFEPGSPPKQNRLRAIPHPHPVNPKTVARQPPPEKLLLGCAARMVVKESGALIKATCVRGVPEAEELEIKLMAHSSVADEP